MSTNRINTTAMTRLIAANPAAASDVGMRCRRCGLFLVLLLALLASITGCKQTEPAWPADGGPSVAPAGTPVVESLPVQPAPPAISPGATQLREGDVVQVTFGAETNLNSVAKIQLDGAIVLPLVGSVHAGGMTLQTLQADLKQRYDRLIKNSELTVTLAATSASVYVSGAVLRPGRIPLDRPLTAMEAVMEAGGFDPNRAKPSAVSVLRMENGQQKRYKVNLKSALKEGDTHPFQLRPFDIVHVPEKTFNF